MGTRADPPPPWNAAVSAAHTPRDHGASRRPARMVGPSAHYLDDAGETPAVPGGTRRNLDGYGIMMRLLDSQRGSMRDQVFISYSHDSDEHREKVLGLAERLRQDGLDAQLDQYVKGTPEQGWPRWMLDRLDEASSSWSCAPKPTTAGSGATRCRAGARASTGKAR